LPIFSCDCLACAVSFESEAVHAIHVESHVPVRDTWILRLRAG